MLPNLCGPCVADVINEVASNFVIRPEVGPDWYLTTTSHVADELEALSRQLHDGTPTRGRWINNRTNEILRMVAVTEVNHVLYCVTHAARCGRRL